MIPRLHKTNKVLAINFGGIGDEVLFLPALKTLREAYPDAHITLMLEPRSESIEQITDLIDATTTFDIKKRPLLIGDLVEVVARIRDGGYELVLSSGSSPMVSILLFLGGSDWRIGYDSGPLSRLLLTHPVPLNRDQYAADMYHDLSLVLTDGKEKPPAQSIPKVVVPLDSMQRMQEFLTSNNIVFDTKLRKVLLHPGTSRLAIEKGIIKTWAIENWIALIDKLSADGSIQPILAGGPDDTEIIAAITKDLPPNSRLISSAGKTKSLADLAALTKVCDLLVCVDSAPMHIGVGLKKRMVAMFGPTDAKKLLPDDPRFKALIARAFDGTTPGVQLSPDVVFQAVMDQLRFAG